MPGPAEGTVVHHCVLCELGGFFNEERGRVPSTSEEMRAVVKYLMQTEGQLPDRHRYRVATKRFNEKVIGPVLRANLGFAAPSLRKVTAAEFRMHLTRHMLRPDRDVLSEHVENLDKLARTVWDNGMVVPDPDGQGDTFEGKNAKLYVDCVKTLVDMTTKRRQWRTEDAEACANVAAGSQDDVWHFALPRKRNRSVESYL